MTIVRQETEIALSATLLICFFVRGIFDERNSYWQQELHMPDSPQNRLARWCYPRPLLKSHAARFEY
jgi:hypothetical protein